MTNEDSRVCCAKGCGAKITSGSELCKIHWNAVPFEVKQSFWFRSYCGFFPKTYEHLLREYIDNPSIEVVEKQCTAPRCRNMTSPEQFLCKEHWKSVPRHDMISMWEAASWGRDKGWFENLVLKYISEGKGVTV